MKVEATLPPAYPPSRTSQEIQTKTTVSSGEDGKARVKEITYATTLYDHKGQVVDVVRSWTAEYQV